MREPVNNPQITSPYGVERNFMYNGKMIHDTHDGIDYIDVTEDRRVYPILSGRILIAEWHYTSGYYVVMQHQHEQLRFLKYCHLETLNVKKNQHVDETTPLGSYGKVGITTGPHVHVSGYDSAWKHFNFGGLIENQDFF